MNQRKIWWCDVAERDLWRWGFTTGTFFIKEQAWASFTRSENHLRKLKDFNIYLTLRKLHFFLTYTDALWHDFWMLRSQVESNNYNDYYTKCY